MSNEANREYIRTVREAYRKADRKEKTLMIRHSMAVTGLSRKRIIRLLNAPKEKLGLRPRGRRPSYGEDVFEHVKRIWFLMEQPCGKKLKAIIPRLLPSYRKRAPDLTIAQEEKLQAMSAATMERHLKALRVKRGIGMTKAPTTSWYKNAIPVQPKDWNITAPGYAQADTVSHCGESAAGAFSSTLTLTDIDSHWTEMRATFTKHHTGIIRALRDIEQGLPFVLSTLKFDSGSEFMNYGVVSFLKGHGPSYGRLRPIAVLRSRPYRKNDNCYVEQKNLTHVRQFIGYDRIESQRATDLLDDLYKNYWCPFLNFFMPTFKLIRKERVGSKIKKQHEAPKTPYERLLLSEAVTQEQKQKLQASYQALDPFELKEKIEEKLKLLLETIRSDTKQDDALKQIA
jgi:SOS-response transcriptional repressor LexA